MRKIPFMIDICAGLGGASAAMKKRGWDVITVDINPEFNTDIVCDIRYWSWIGETPDLIWCSPPCDEFSREFMPWSKTGKEPSTQLVNACKRIIYLAKPRYWVIENVKGSVKYIKPILGNPSYVCNPYYLWGVFPDISHVRVKSNKEKLSSSNSSKRAVIPFELSNALAEAIEKTIPLEMLI